MNKRIDPPRFAHRFLQWFCPDHLLEEIEGDLLQKFNRDVKSYGEKKAGRRFFWNVMRFFRLAILLRNKFATPLISFFMLRNYLKISVRSLWTYKGNSFINLLGLVIGIACALVILSIIRYELSFDMFHTNADQIYRVVRVSLVEGQEEYNAGVSYPLPDALKNELASIDNITTVHYHRNAQIDVLNEDGTTRKKFQESEGVALTEPSFFDVFDFNGTNFKWIAGNPETALAEPFSIVLTRSIAEKYFSNTDILGKTLRLEQQLDFKITGVVEDLPPNTDFPFTIFLSYSTFYEFQPDEMKNDWFSVASVNQCYLILPPSINKNDIGRQITRIRDAHVPKEAAGSRQYKLQALREVHQDERFGNYNLRTVSSNTLWTLAFAGIILILIACINYVNLATAQSALRSKEIGIRKVLGSQRRQLIFQFLSEAFLIALAASVVGLIVAHLIVVNLQPLINIKMEHYLFLDWFVLKFLFLTIIVITLLSGFYPALIISGFNSLTAIKNKLTTPGGSYLRKALVVTQFSVTQIFVICAFVVLSQMHYFNNVDLGFEKESIINVLLPQNYQGKLNGLKDRLGSESAISTISISSSSPAGFKRALWFTSIRRREADPKNALGCEYQSVDHSYIDLYGIKMVAGRNFNASDSLDYLIINETLATEAGYQNAEDAVGKEMIMDHQLYTVIGVMKDFHSKSLKEGFDKIAFAMRPNMYRLANIKFNSSSSSHSWQETLRHVEKVWATTFPESVFDYRFFDENIDAYYQEEAKFSKLAQLFSVIFLTISCMGLYGLISFVVNRKLKEAAIRKVFGASMFNVWTLISRDYVNLILIAFIVAAPISYYYMDKWLSGFAYHIDISWWILVMPGLLVFVIAMVAVSGQSLRAARSNPADTLKYE